MNIMNSIVDRLFDHLIADVGGVAVFVDNEPWKVTKKCILKHVTCDGRELTCAGPSQSENAMRMRELCKNLAYRARENERKRHRRKRKKTEKKKNEEEAVLRRIFNQSIFSDYGY